MSLSLKLIVGVCMSVHELLLAGLRLLSRVRGHMRLSRVERQIMTELLLLSLLLLDVWCLKRYSQVFSERSEAVL